MPRITIEDIHESLDKHVDQMNAELMTDDANYYGHSTSPEAAKTVVTRTADGGRGAGSAVEDAAATGRRAGHAEGEAKGAEAEETVTEPSSASPLLVQLSVLSPVNSSQQRYSRSCAA